MFIWSTLFQELLPEPLLTSEMQTQFPSRVSFQRETLLSPPETASILPETDLSAISLKV